MKLHPWSLEIDVGGRCVVSPGVMETWQISRLLGITVRLPMWGPCKRGRLDCRFAKRSQSFVRVMICLRYGDVRPLHALGACASLCILCTILGKGTVRFSVAVRTLCETASIAYDNCSPTPGCRVTGPWIFWGFDFRIAGWSGFWSTGFVQYCALRLNLGKAQRAADKRRQLERFHVSDIPQGRSAPGYFRKNPIWKRWCRLGAA